MRQIFGFLLALCLLPGLCGCGQSGAVSAGGTLTWQEQYDLGIKYLSEGNYEEAIIAFTAAIEIDPKRPEAYLGLADVYLTQGETETARTILQQGCNATGDAELRQRLEALTGPGEEKSEEFLEEGTVTVTGVVIDNTVEYAAGWQAFLTQNPAGGDMENYGIRFTEPVAVSFDGGTVLVSEAALIGDAAIRLGQAGMPGSAVEVTGLLEHSSQIYAPEDDGSVPLSHYEPNGDYYFLLLDYSVE